MCLTFLNFGVCISIVLSCSSVTSGEKSKPQTVSSDQVKNEMESFELLMGEINNTVVEKLAAEKHKGVIKRALKAELENKQLIEEKASLKIEKKTAEKLYMKNIYRAAIDELEDTFPQPFDEDFETKKVPYDKAKLNAKTGFDRIEESRRQKWNHYLHHPPNTKIENIVRRAEEQRLSLDTLAEGIAKAYRYLSEEFHQPIKETNKINGPKMISSRRIIVVSLRILLNESDILPEYIDQLEL